MSVPSRSSFFLLDVGPVGGSFFLGGERGGEDLPKEGTQPPAEELRSKKRNAAAAAAAGAILMQSERSAKHNTLGIEWGLLKLPKAAERLVRW